jgi:hypothetical protein
MSSGKEYLYAGIAGVGAILQPELAPFFLIVAGAILVYYHL